MSKDLGYIPYGSPAFGFYFNTTDPDTGAPITLAGAPSLECRKDGDNTEDTSGLTLTVDEDGKTGLHYVAVDMTTDLTFYAEGARVSIQLAAGTVDGISVVAHELAFFIIGYPPREDVTHRAVVSASASVSEFTIPAGHPWADADEVIGQTVVPYYGTGDKQRGAIVVGFNPDGGAGVGVVSVSPGFAVQLAAGSRVAFVATPLQAGPYEAKVKIVNETEIQGTGVAGDRMRPV
jgi:hypothetical protein